MVKYKIHLTIAFAILLALGLWYFFPSDTKIIKRQLNEMATEISFPQTEHVLETIKRSRIITHYVASTVDISITYDGEVRQREFSNSDLQQRIVALSKNLAPVTVQLKDLTVIVTKQQAQASFTAIISRGSAKAAETAEKYAQEITSNWRKIDQNWQLTSIENIEVIEWKR